jgi:hypothetical protein
VDVSDHGQNRRHPQERGKEVRELSREALRQGDAAQAFDPVGSELDASVGRVSVRQGTAGEESRTVMAGMPTS